MRAIVISGVLCLALAGCGIRGTYIDPVGPDTAKLRFVSYTANSTVDYFDQHVCEGRTTGLLNNWFIRDADRRVNMRVPAPPDARGYLEIAIAADTPVVLSTNSLDAYGASCGSPVVRSFERGREYELTLRRSGRRCTVSLVELTHGDGTTLRTPKTFATQGKLLACAGRRPRFLSE